jgi:hypothetical protein
MKQMHRLFTATLLIKLRNITTVLKETFVCTAEQPQITKNINIFHNKVPGFEILTSRAIDRCVINSATQPPQGILLIKQEIYAISKMESLTKTLEGREKGRKHKNSLFIQCK